MNLPTVSEVDSNVIDLVLSQAPNICGYIINMVNRSMTPENASILANVLQCKSPSNWCVCLTERIATRILRDMFITDSGVSKEGIYKQNNSLVFIYIFSNMSDEKT